MPIDTSMYGMMPDYGGSFERGLRLGDLGRQRREKREIDDVYKANVVQGPDGKTSFNREGVLSGLAKLNPEKFQEAQDRFAADDAKAAQAKVGQLDLLARLAGSAQDQASYDQALMIAKDHGLDVSQLPRQFDPNLTKRYQMMALDAKEQIAQRFRETQHADQLKENARNRADSRQRQERELDVKLAESGVTRNFQAEQQGKQFAHEKEMAGIKGQQQRDAYEAKLKALAEAKGGTNSETYVPGVGHALTKDDAKTLKDAKEMKMKFDRQVGELINLRKEKGVEYMDRDAVARGKQLSKDLLLTYKNLSKLGVLSKSDEAIVARIIPEDPLGQDWAPGQDPILHQLEKFQGDLDSDYANTLSTRTKRLEPGAVVSRPPGQSGGASSSWGVNEANAVQIPRFKTDQIDWAD